uniref:Uncharacterized protein n=1 Tax=Sciurus vulgaris TaxID=55149 RepID=A0A8D2B822_SCIVU
NDAGLVSMALLLLGRGAAPSTQVLTRTWGNSEQRGLWCFRTMVIVNPGTLKRGLLFSTLFYLGFETYQVISQAAVIHATAKVEEIFEQADYLYESGESCLVAYRFVKRI